MSAPTPPTHWVVFEFVCRLSDVQREEYEERAGILEFEGKLSRPHAECLALLDVLYRHSVAMNTLGKA